MTIDTELIKFPEEELAGLLQFFPRDNSGNHVVRYNLVEAGRATDPLLNHDFKGTTTIAFSNEEIAFIESVFRTSEYLHCHSAPGRHKLQRTAATGYRLS